MKLILVVGPTIAILLFMAGVRADRKGRPRITTLLRRSALVTLLAVPCAFLAAPLVFRFDLWQAKRFLVRQIAPRLEQERASSGSFPRELRDSETANAPYLLRTIIYV